MGGFANLKKDFHDIENQHLSDLDGPSAQFYYLLLRCLFEINGNLDSIAIEMKKQTEMVELYRGFLDHLSNQPQYSYYNATKSKTRKEEAL